MNFDCRFGAAEERVQIVGLDIRQIAKIHSDENGRSSSRKWSIARSDTDSERGEWDRGGHKDEFAEGRGPSGRWAWRRECDNEPARQQVQSRDNGWNNNGDGLQKRRRSQERQ